MERVETSPSTRPVSRLMRLSRWSHSLWLDQHTETASDVNSINKRTARPIKKGGPTAGLAVEDLALLVPAAV